MKTWQSLLLGILMGLFISGAILLIIAPPRGKPIELSPQPTPAPLVVYVTGSVIHPGVYSLPRLSRVSNAIAAAGGLLPDADQSAVNLAARLLDGQKIVVPKISTPAPVTKTNAPQVQAKTQQPGSQSSITTPSADNPLNLNTATQEDLDLLPGIGPTRAADIIAYRTQHGSFKTTDEIMNVTGIGQTTYDRIKAFIYVDSGQ
jgi:competence protein ComEA